MNPAITDAYTNNQWLAQRVLGWKSLTVFPLNLEVSTKGSASTCKLVIYNPYDQTVSRATYSRRTVKKTNGSWHYDEVEEGYLVDGKEVTLSEQLKLAPKNARNLGISKKHPQYFWFDNKHPNYKTQATLEAYNKLPESSMLVLASAVEVFIDTARENDVIERYSRYDVEYVVDPIQKDFPLDINTTFSALFRYIGSELDLGIALNTILSSATLPELKKDLLIAGLERELSLISEEDLPLYLDVDRKFGLITPDAILEYLDQKPLSKGRIVARLDKMVPIFKDRKVTFKADVRSYYAKERELPKLDLLISFANALLWKHLTKIQAYSYLTANAQKYFDLILARLISEGASIEEVGNLLFEHPSVYGLDIATIGIIYEKLGKMPDAFFTCFKSSQNFHELIALHQKLNRADNQIADQTVTA